MDLENFDPKKLGMDFVSDPYPVYRAIRQSDPVKLCPDGSYFLSKHQDLSDVYKDTKKFSSDKKVEFKPKFGDTPLYEHHTTSLIFNDPHCIPLCAKSSSVPSPRALLLIWKERWLNWSMTF